LLLYIATGAVLALVVTSFTPTVLQPTLLNLFLSGAIAICAMILPGVSGSFLLLLMGMYAPVITAIKEFELIALSAFASSCAVGLIAFTHLLSRLLKRYYDVTMATLPGFMIGALNKVWPWKITVEYRFNPDGADRPVLQNNISPLHYEAVTGEPSHWPWVLLLVVFGVLMVLILEMAGSKSKIVISH
jgi:putative membrane protein